MFDAGIWFAALAGLAVVALGGWIVSIPLRNVSIVDALWSLMFLLAAVIYVRLSAFAGARQWLLLSLVSLWALRLAVHISWRNAGHGEDRRYQAIRRNNEPGFVFKSVYIVFGLQALLAWIISLPLLATALSPRPLNLLDAAGAALWLVGFIFEAGGDLQLARFKADAANQGKVMDRGLWRYTRHPNYFGDFCVWWGLFLVALALGAPWWTGVGPVLMSVLLMRVSGVALLERSLSRRKPGYEEYVRRTSAFFPRPPQRR